MSYNAGHVADIVEPGGGPGGSDRVFEAKVASPLTANANQGTAAISGPRPPKTGNLFAFGDTEESYRLMILGNKQLGVPGDGAFDHTTGQGFVKQRDGH